MRASVCVRVCVRACVRHTDVLLVRPHLSPCSHTPGGYAAYAGAGPRAGGGQEHSRIKLLPGRIDARGKGSRRQGRQEVTEVNSRYRIFGKCPITYRIFGKFPNSYRNFGKFPNSYRNFGKFPNFPI